MMDRRIAGASRSERWFYVVLLCIAFQVIYRMALWPTDVNDGMIINHIFMGILICAVAFAIPKWSAVVSIIGLAICIIGSDMLVSWVYPLRHGFDVRSLGSLSVEIRFKANDYYSQYRLIPVILLFAGAARVVVALIRSGFRTERDERQEDAPAAPRP